LKAEGKEKESACSELLFHDDALYIETQQISLPGLDLSQDH